MKISDFIHFTPGGKIRYHWHLLPIGEWVCIDMIAGRSSDNTEVDWSGDDGQGFYWYRKSLGEKLRKAVGVYGSVNKLSTSVTFQKPYEKLHLYIGD